MAAIAERYKGCNKLERCAYNGFLMLLRDAAGSKPNGRWFAFVLLFIFMQSRVKIGVKTSMSEWYQFADSLREI